MCGGFATTCGSRISHAGAWHAGRLCTYSALGALAGAFGGLVPGPGWILSVVSAVLLTWFAAALAGLVKEPSFSLPFVRRKGVQLADRQSAGARFAFGMTTGLLPCGLVYAALSVPVASGNPLWGALTMVAFGLGTVPALLAFTLGLRTLVARSLAARRALAAAVLVAGLWSIVMRQTMMI